ncbi:MAG: hypothetical protein GY726_11000 [Proteobacteria bacterium]|nr:hypothetical protein [Pseudomonadota bacterium]
MYTDSTEQQHKKLARANTRLALLLGGVVLFALFATFYFWLSPQVP